MDLERLKRVQAARANLVTAANEDLPEAEKGNVEELKKRFKALAERMAQYVPHEHYSYPDDRGYYTRYSAAREIGGFESPMPDVSVRFKYLYRVEDGTMSSHVRGMAANEHGERIEIIMMEFLEHPEGVNSDPSPSSTEIPIMTKYGEVFATETLSFGALQSLEKEYIDQNVEYFSQFHPSVTLRLLEQAMDQYEAAPPSPYEIREGLVTKQ